MEDNCNVMISIHSDHADNIVRGIKTVELRRRFLSLPKGAKLWIYSTLPVGAIVATATVALIERDCPKVLWKKYRSSAAISKTDFIDYFTGCSRGCAISLENVEPIPPVPLSSIRSIRGIDHIPQVATKISAIEAQQFAEYIVLS